MSGGPCAVYVITNAPLGYVKVGISNQPDVRLARFRKVWLSYFMSGEWLSMASKETVDKAAAGGSAYIEAVKEVEALYYARRYPEIVLEVWLNRRGHAEMVEEFAHRKLAELATGDYEPIYTDGGTEMFPVGVLDAVRAVVDGIGSVEGKVRANSRIIGDLCLFTGSRL